MSSKVEDIATMWYNSKKHKNAGKLYLNESWIILQNWLLLCLFNIKISLAVDGKKTLELTLYNSKAGWVGIS